jgi:predicted GH43/DUF377 family glycosyl hydrolase
MMFHYLFIFCCFLVPLGAKIDSTLKELLSNDSIIEARQIKIPGYPNAYNPSLIPYKDGYLLSFRYITRYPETIESTFRGDVSFIGLARLDKNFKVSKKSVQLLHAVSYSDKISLTAEDARLLHIGGKILIFFNDLPPLGTDGGSSMYFGELQEEGGFFVLKEDARLLNYAFAWVIEKNWVPFVSEEKLYLIYSDNPRVVLSVDINTGYCEEVSYVAPNYEWDLGLIRGGTPACLADDLLLTFFHSSFPAPNTPKKRVYVMGAYLFDRAPPFSIRAITPFPLGNITDYTEENSCKVIFPGGIVVQDDRILVAWGKADKQIWITTFDKKKLLSSMEICP